MASNSFGNFLRYTTWGESHGSQIGCVLDGVPPGLELSVKDIQPFLDKRRPGASAYTSKRQEPDKVEILSGVFEGRTTGAPISITVLNQDYRSEDYHSIKDKFRPGHADHTYFLKYKNFNDYRGGGRSSARETAMRVVAGAVARKIIPSIQVQGFISQIGPHKLPPLTDIEGAKNNELYCPDIIMLKTWKKYLKFLEEQGNSAASIIELRAYNVPAGIGEPIYNKLSAEIARAMMSINAVKGVEIGAGFSLCNFTGNESNDQMVSDSEGNITFLSNSSGGIVGGISNGEPIIIRIILKPTSSIKSTLKTVDKDCNNTIISTAGRHDPCLGPRCVPVAEAMLCFTIADYCLVSKINCG